MMLRGGIIYLKHTRQVIERAFGVAKIRFRCIHKSGGELTYDPLKLDGLRLEA